MAASPKTIEANVDRVRETIASACARVGRSAAEVQIIGVTKTADLEDIKTLVRCGVTQLGESRVQQLTERAEQLAPWLAQQPLASEVRWHLIGHLQRNKVKPVLHATRIIHSVDSLRLAEDIDERAEQMDATVEVMLQVNCSQEPQKFGVAVGAACHLAELLGTLKNLRLVGLMTMAPLSENPENARPTFARLRELFDEIRGERLAHPDHFRHLSMGMSGDYPVAVEEGATMVRVGTALFA